MLVKILNGAVDRYPYSVAELKKDFPNTSFSQNVEKSDLSAFNVFEVLPVARPVVDYTKVVLEEKPALISGKWTQVWLVRDATDSEKEKAFAVVRAGYGAQVQNHLNVVVRLRDYDDIVSACSYVSSTNPKYSAEGQSCVAWRDAVWEETYKILDDVWAGIRPLPTIEELLSELPSIVWPSN